MANKFYYYLLLIVLIGSMIFGGTDGQLRGNVANIEGEPLIGAQIFIKELGIGAVADIDGNYILLNIPVDSYDITVTMISYRTQIYKDVNIVMDNTVWLNFSLDVEAIEGDVIYVSAKKDLVDKGTTSKKITVSSEAIEALPIRDVSDLYSLQSGVVKVEGGTRGAIPGHEEKGLEEVHVRGGRSGEIAYLIDGMYIRNPIYGGIGNGTRINLFAVKEWDWQPGGFNAEYGDAMSAISNYHTSIGGSEFTYKFKYETSLVGQALGSHYDELRGYNDYNLGFGGSLPFIKKLKYWVSGQYTTEENYQVYQFDSLAYDHNDPGNINNKNNMVQPWDDTKGFRGFGLNDTWDIFGKLQYKLTDKLRFLFSYWTVSAHRKGFSPLFLYWDNGQNEIFRDTDRLAFEMNHTLSPKTFYSIKYARFEQEAFIGVRMHDSDNDGYPDWYEWRYGAGDRTNGSGTRQVSDHNNPYVIPYYMVGDTVRYQNRDGLGPQNGSSGWYYGAEPGNYNWEVAEDFDDKNGDYIYQPSIDYFDYDCSDGFCHDDNGDGVWNPPSLIEKCQFRDGDYWLTPEMYIDNEEFLDLEKFWQELNQDPYLANPQSSGAWNEFFFWYGDSLYFLPQVSLQNEGEDDEVYVFGEWIEGKSFGGHDRFYSTSNALTNELRFDLTSQLTGKWRSRVGIDVKSHKLNFYEIENPWLGPGASKQRFAEQWDDYGIDGIQAIYDDEDNKEADKGEGNGKWDEGEVFDDFNGNGRWDDYVEPMEVAAYFQNTFEVPWMVINAGIRIDAVDYNTKIWSDPNGNYSPTKPWFWQDCGKDLLCDSHDDIRSENADGYHVPDIWDGEDNGEWDTFTDENGDTFSEITTDNFGTHGSKVFFEYSDWLYKISPRLGVSHVITDGATFTFNYGMYYQTPVYENIYLNTSRQANPQELIVQGDGFLGNATMSASRTQSYEFGFNIQVGQNWAYSVMGWVKDMDQLSTAKTYRSMLGEYQVASNGDYGVARGIDITLENQGQKVNTMIQYTYSKAKANGEYDKDAFGADQIVDAPSQEFTMPFDRPHDLTVQLYASDLPFDFNAALTGFYQSGLPYTGTYELDSGEPKPDLLRKYGKRADAFKQIDLSLSKFIEYDDAKITLGLNIFNVFDIRNPIDIYPETGDPTIRSEYYTQYIGLPEDGKSLSNSFYDTPWHFSSPREINFFIRFDYK